jgi:hypothetical protein
MSSSCSVDNCKSPLLDVAMAASFCIAGVPSDSKIVSKVVGCESSVALIH